MRYLRRIGALLAVFPLLASCTLLNGNDGTVSGPNTRNLEKSTITVGLLAAPSAAPAYLAKQDGDFTTQGLTVNIQATTGGSAAIPRVVAGDYDFATTNVATAISAEANNTPLVIVAEAYDAAPGMYVVETLKQRHIETVSDLVHHTVAVNTLADIGTLGFESILSANSIDPTQVKFVIVQFKDMEESLKTGAVDAIATQEPYLTSTRLHIGSQDVTDIFGARQPLAGIPIAAVVTTAAFAKQHPRTVCAFQAAWKAGADRTTSRADVEHILTTYTGVNLTVAKMLHLGVFSTDVNAKRIARVAGAMWTYGLLKKQVDVTSMMPAPCPG